VFNQLHHTVTEVVGVFVRFRAPLQLVRFCLEPFEPDFIIIVDFIFTSSDPVKEVLFGKKTKIKFSV
jgi:hypothetical protein